VAAYLLDGVFVGAARSREMRNATGLAAVVFLALANGISGSNDLLWAAYLLHLVVRAVVLMAYFPDVERSACGTRGLATDAKPLLSA